jgi:A/G-specific adenine glycosylase
LSDVCAWHGDPAVADPATASAGVSRRQGRFEGSDRQARGRLLKRLGQGSVRVDDVPEIVGREFDIARKIVDGLVRDGLCVIANDSIRLP